MKVLVDTNIALDIFNNIVTRNTQDFASASIVALTPEQFMQTIDDID